MENKDQKKSLFDKFFNLDEFKNIALVVALFVSLGFGIYFCFTDKDIPQNLTMIILTLVGAISGASLVGIVSNSIASRNNNQYMNQYGNQYSGMNSSYGSNSSLYSNSYGMSQNPIMQNQNIPEENLGVPITSNENDPSKQSI